MKTIKTIADLKRAVKVGAKIGYIHYNNRSSKTPAGEFISEAIHKPIREISVGCMSSGTCTMLGFNHKTFCAITYTRCYKLVRFKNEKL